MNGFSTVEKLKELEQKDPAWQSQDGSVTADVDYLSALYSAAPLLLDIAWQIRPEDGKRFASMIRTMENDIEWDHDREIDLLRRYQKMAERMHETNA